MAKLELHASILKNNLHGFLFSFSEKMPCLPFREVFPISIWIEKCRLFKPFAKLDPPPCHQSFTHSFHLCMSVNRSLVILKKKILQNIGRHKLYDQGKLDYFAKSFASWAILCLPLVGQLVDIYRQDILVVSLKRKLSGKLSMRFTVLFSSMSRFLLGQLVGIYRPDILVLSQNICLEQPQWI